MKRAVFVTTPFLDQNIEFLGEDGEVYVLKPAEVVVIPWLNAVNFERAKLGQIIGEYGQQDVTDINTLGDYDLIREWAETMLQMELQKPKPNPDRVIELRMLINGINPATLLNPKESPRIDNNQPIKTPQKATHSYPTSPTVYVHPLTIRYRLVILKLNIKMRIKRKG